MTVSVMSELDIDIGELIINTDIGKLLEANELSFEQIAAKLNVSLDQVDAVAEQLREQYAYEDGMDGDHQSALASCGWGTDEDYVCDNDYFDDF